MSHDLLPTREVSAAYLAVFVFMATSLPNAMVFRFAVTDMSDGEMIC